MKNILLAITSVLIISTIAFAEYRIAFVNVTKLLNDSPEAKEKRSSLDARAKKTRDSLEQQREELRTTEKKLRDANTPENSKEVSALKSKARDFERSMRESEEALRSEYIKINRSLSERLIKAINAIAKEKALSIVLDKGELGRSAVLFGDKQLDITDLVEERMGV